MLKHILIASLIVLMSSVTQAQNSSVANSIERINESVPKTVDYPVKGPVPIHMTYEDENTGIVYSPKLNWLTIIDGVQESATNEMGSGVVVQRQSTHGVRFFTATNRKVYIGAEILDVKDKKRIENPALNQIPSMIDELATDFLSSKANGEPDAQIKLISGGWYLMYNNKAEEATNAFTDVDDPNRLYSIRFNTVIARQSAVGRNVFNKRGRVVGVTCRYTSEARKLSEWKKNDYEAVVRVKQALLDTCRDRVAGNLPKLLGTQAVPLNQQIKGAVLNCKAQYLGCTAVAKRGNSSGITEQSCLADYKQCRVREEGSLKAMTPAGYCKPKLRECKEKLPAEADRSSYEQCVKDYDSCVEAREQLIK